MCQGIGQACTSLCGCLIFSSGLLLPNGLLTADQSPFAREGIATAPLPDDVQKNLALVSACVGGAATIDDTEKLLQEAGFQNIKIRPNDESRELIRQWDPTKSDNASDYVVSAYIEAVKPD